MARMRAVENHRWLLRDTNTGITAVIDPYGRVVAEAPRNQRTRLQAAYSLEETTTFYTRHGDWFPLVCAIITLLGLLLRSSDLQAWRKPLVRETLHRRGTEDQDLKCKRRQRQPRISRVARIILRLRANCLKAPPSVSCLKSCKMVEELEQEYAALRDKVHDLQEYL